MLICPQCKFENPNTNKFCQNCGTSLTQKVCPECGTCVAVNAEQCHHCGAFCGTVWSAIITKEETLETEEASGVEKSNKTDKEINFPLCYLDLQRRYRLLEPLPAMEHIPPNTEVCLRVLDCQPFQMSPLSVMLANQQKGLGTSSVGDGKIPRLAKPYVDLQPQCYQGIPPIHDAWQQGDMQVILIEDRSDWPYLLNLWPKDTTTSLQIIQFFYQMTLLWGLLEPLNCCQSLLELSNLRLDKNQTLMLQRLYVEPMNNMSSSQSLQDAQAPITTVRQEPLTIKALGSVWQALFRQSQRTQFGSFVQLLGDLEIGKIATLVQLRSRLEAIAIALQANSTTSTAMPTQPPTATPPTQKTTAAPTILQLDEPEESNTQSDDLPTGLQPMQLITLENAGRTDVGRQRQHNEDYFSIETTINKLISPKNSVVTARALYILCDGMGGHAGGEVASELAANTLRQYFQEHWSSNQLPSEDIIRQGVLSANQAIYDVNQQDARSGVGRMGTTLVVVLIQDTQVAVAHVGDSRLYCLTRQRGLQQITVDHEVGQREISRGVEPTLAYARPDAYQLTQALGPRQENLINPDVRFFEIHEDSLLVLASDGLSDNDLLEIHWQTHLEPLLSSDANLERGVRDLIDLANQYNGHDNITAILIQAKVSPYSEQEVARD